MKISLIAVGTKMPGWVEQGIAEYSKRLPREIDFQIVEIPLAKRGKTSSVAQNKTLEGEAILAAIPKGDLVIALDVLGKSISTGAMAARLADWQMSGDNVSVLVGGPDGLATSCLELARSKWSLSGLTLPHPLVRILFAEQLYRAWSINSNHPYHK